MLDENGHEMFPEDESALLQIKAMVTSIWRGLHGNPSYKQEGLISAFDNFKIETQLKIKEMELRMLKLEQIKWKWIIGAALFVLGFVVATGVYFGLSLKQVKDIITK